MANGNESGSTDPSVDPNNPANGSGGNSQAADAAALWHLFPRQPATFPNYVPGYDGGYANLGAQIQDAFGMPGRYSQGWMWGNGAGRYAFGSGAPYGNPSGRAAPWYVTGDNGQAGQYPGWQGQPGGQQGLLGQPQQKSLGTNVQPTGMLGQQPFGGGMNAGPQPNATGSPQALPGMSQAAITGSNPQAVAQAAQGMNQAQLAQFINGAGGYNRAAILNQAGVLKPGQTNGLDALFTQNGGLSANWADPNAAFGPNPYYIPGYKAGRR